MLKLENLLKLMQATGDAPRVDNLNFVNLQVLQSITGVFSKEVQNQIAELDSVQTSSGKELSECAGQLM